MSPEDGGSHPKNATSTSLFEGCNTYGRCFTLKGGKIAELHVFELVTDPPKNSCNMVDVVNSKCNHPDGRVLLGVTAVWVVALAVDHVDHVVLLVLGAAFGPLVEWAVAAARAILSAETMIQRNVFGKYYIFLYLWKLCVHLCTCMDAFSRRSC